MASRIPMAKDSFPGGEKRTQNQQGGSGSLWGNQDEMRRYVSKLKSELAEQKNRVKRVHRDRAEEIKRLQDNLDNEKQKAIENVSKKLESDKAYELKKMKESVVRQKESELRQVLRVKDDEMRALKQELQESRNISRTLELENKRIISEQARGETNEQDRRWKSEIGSLRSEKRRLEESLRIKSEADFEKAELIRKMKQDHDSEIRRLTRESKRESLKEFRQLRAASREVELKTNQLAAREADLKRLQKEKNHLGNELNSQRKGSVKKSSSFNSQRAKALSVSQNSESDFDNVAEEKIKKLKMRNSELVAIARKLEEKAKQLQEEKELLERSNELNNPEVGTLKKAFARQRARDLAERAKLVMNKDNEINNLKKEVEETRHNGLNENGCAEELEKIVHQTSKEHLLLEKQVSQKIEDLTEEIKDLNAKNAKLTNDNDIFKERAFKLQDLESKNDKILRELKEARERNAVLENACSEKDKRLYQLELEKQTYTKENDALQKKNDELLCKINQLNKVEQECCDLKENVETLMNENRSVKEENARLRSQTENLSAVKKDVERLREENIALKSNRENVILKLEERDNEILSLHEAQEVAQRKYSEEVSGLEDMVRRLKEQQVQSMQERNLTGTPDSTSSVVTSTPKDTKCTQTSRPSSPVMSPIVLNGTQEFQRDSEQDVDKKRLNDNDVGQNLLSVPYNGTSSSTSFDLENAGTRIQQLAASDSDDIGCNGVGRMDQESSVSSEISGYSEEASGDGAVSEVDTSYSADVSQASDTEELCADKTLQDEQQGSDYEDPRNDPDMYIDSPLQDLPDLEEKLSIFIAKYNYDPMLYSPNENPEMELAFQAGDYLYVYGDVDEDGFYVGELMNGERGLVPSNFVEQIAEDEAILKESGKIDDDFDSEEDSSDEEVTLKDEDGERKVIRPKAFSERRHEWFRSSLDHVLTDQLGDIRESDEDDLGASSLSEDELGNRKNRHNRSRKPEADQVSSEGFDSMDSDVPEPRIPSPTKLYLDRQFANSALISWRGAQLPNDEIQGYNIYVDGKFKTQVKGSKKTNAVVEDIKPTETYRLSVRTKSVTGMESPDNEATMIIGPDAPLSPSDVQVVKITTTSGQVHWLPAHSSYQHEIFLNETLLECIKPGCTSYTINNLSPATFYQVQVRTLIPEHLTATLGKIPEEDLSAEVEFTTSDGGLPEPPVDLRLAQRMSDKIILTWLPVTLSQDGYSNGYKVSGYKVYVNGVFCMEIVSACVDNVEISMEHLKNLGRRHDFSRMRFVVRTLSVMGESVNSNVVEVSWDESQDLASLDAYSELKITEEQRTTDANESAKLNKANLESECAQLEKNSNIGLLESDPRSVQSSSEVSRSESISQNNVAGKDDDSENLKEARSSKGSISEQHIEPDRTSIVSEKAEVDWVDKDAVEGSRRLNTCAEKGFSRKADGPAMIDRKPPIVTRYEDLETESESNSTESKTQDTEEELIERFEQLEISQKSNAGESSKDVKEIPEQVSISPAEHRSEISKTKESNNTETTSGQLDSDLRSSEKLDSTQQELRISVSDNSEKRDTESVCTVNVENSDTSGEARTRNDENHKPDSPTETEAPANSPTTEHHTESETDSENQDERRHSKDFQTLVQNAVSLDGDSGKQEQLPTLSGGPLQSESETDTEYGPPLSVIDEVDEDNLTDTNNPQRSTGTTTSDGEATLSNKQIKSLPADSSKSSDLTATRSRTATSDDEGFRTEDDVLDLLDDDDDGGIVKDSGGNEGRSEVKKEKCEGASMVNKGDKSNDNDGQDNGVNNDSIGSNNDQGIVGDMSVKQGKNENSAEGNSDSLGHTETLNYSIPAKPNDCVGKPDTVNSNIQDNNEALTNGHTTEDESSENFSTSTCPTRTSFKSDSSISEDPPAAEHALETIMATLSLPSNRGITSGESDHSGNMLSGLEEKSGVISERNGSESEVSENVSEPVRYFVALYSYDPSLMSPNVDGADEELPFNEGDIIKVFGEKDDDGFFWGQCKLKQGFVPSNMIAEMNITEAELLFNQANSDVRLHNELNSRGQVNGELDVDVISDNIGCGENGPNNRLSFWDNLDNDHFEARKMKALYDYDPAADSPNVDSEVELKFKAGEIIFVFGDMDDDGFFKGELNGIHGLVPSNFLQPIKENNLDGSRGNSVDKLNSDSTMSASLSPQERQPNLSSSNKINHNPTDGEIPPKKKKNIFSKGKKIFKKAFK